MKIQAVMLAVTLVACSTNATRVHLDVAFDETWGVDQFQIRIGEHSANAQPLSSLDLQVPNGMAGENATVEVWGLHAGQQVAYGKAQVTPILHGTVAVAITLAMVSCGAFCTVGTTVCANDGSDGTITCESQPDGCVAWSAVTPCPTNAPYCSNGTCASACSDECTGSETMCSGTAAVLHCGNYDGDTCTDWSAPMACPGGQTCSNGACGMAMACANNGDPCDDGDACTQDDACDGGTCSGMPKCTTAPANADPTCSNGTCDFECHNGYDKSGSMCVLSNKIVFITSHVYYGYLPGVLSGADSKCQSLADAASVPGTFKAWLSDSSHSAASRLSHSAGAYVLVDGTVIANDWADLTDGTLQHAIDLDEHGMSNHGTVWTGTDASGNLISFSNCSDWNVSGPPDVGTVGYSMETDAGWTNLQANYCSYVASLYCFQQ